MSLESFDRVPLLFGPSPVHRLERLTEHLGGKVEVWAKREDVNAGLAYGGNKVRKLEYLAAEALAQGCDTLVSIGGVQSNHTRQVAAVAARLGLGCVLVQERWVDWPDVVYDKVGNILLSRIMGAEVRLDPAGFDIGIRRVGGGARLGRGARRQAVRNPGGRVRPSARRARFRSLGGRGGRAGGRARRLLRRDRRLLRHRLDAGGHGRRLRAPGEGALRSGHRRLRDPGTDVGADRENRASHRGGDRTERELAVDEIVLLEEWHAGIYGVPDEKTIEAIRLCARLEGVLTDPVYEGKSMAALIDLVRSGRIGRLARPLCAPRRPAGAERLRGRLLGGRGGSFLLAQLVHAVEHVLECRRQLLEEDELGGRRLLLAPFEQVPGSGRRSSCRCAHPILLRRRIGSMT